MTWDVVLFDLDGTLTHSEPGVLHGVLHALSHYGMEHPAPHETRRYLGPPLHDSFTRFHGMSDAQAHEAVAVYREYYDSTGAYESEVYPGIQDLLADLQSAGRRLAVATSKVEYAAHVIVEHFDLARHFETVVGADPTGALRGTKALVIREAMLRLGLAADPSVVMVGDREHDVRGALENDLASIGAGWGYAAAGELQAAGATAVAATVADLRAMLL